MPEIVVELREPSEQGRLYYHHDPQIDGQILFIQNLKSQRTVFKVVLGGGHVMPAFNADRVLKDVDFIYRWSAWQKSPHTEVPQAKREADLAFVGVQLDNGQWGLPGIHIGTTDKIQRHIYQYDPLINATTDAEYSYVRFLFGSAEPVGEWVTLSHQCLALIDGNYLRGFFVHLKGAPLRQYRNRSTR